MSQNPNRNLNREPTIESLCRLVVGSASWQSARPAHSEAGLGSVSSGSVISGSVPAREVIKHPPSSALAAAAAAAAVAAAADAPVSPVSPAAATTATAAAAAAPAAPPTGAPDDYLTRQRRATGGVPGGVRADVLQPGEAGEADPDEGAAVPRGQVPVLRSRAPTPEHARQYNKQQTNPRTAPASFMELGAYTGIPSS